MCVHGLTRNARDFDYLARDLQQDYRIVCPDLLGRGKSDYMENPYLYTFPQYMNDMVDLLARIGVADVHWLGTSLGGVIGMMLAAQPKSPLKSLILNDVGMVIPSGALKRIGSYVRGNGKFQSLVEARDYLQMVMAPFGIHDEEKWDHVLKYGVWKNKDGTYRLTYDPAIGTGFVKEAIQTIHLENYWNAIRCPVLIIRGEESDLLTGEIVEQMVALKPHTKVITIPGCGHAPSLMEPSQIEQIQGWLKNI